MTASARRLVEVLRDELGALGAEGVLELTPEFPRIALPSAGQRYLDAMARFQLCSLDLMLQLPDPTHRDDPIVRRDATLGLMAITLAVVRLRRPLLALDGSDAGIEAFLTNCAWDALGVPAALRRPGEVRSRCEQSGEPLRLRVGDDGPEGPESAGGLFHCLVPAARWWEDSVFTSSTMLFFRSEERIRQWCAACGEPMRPPVTMAQL